MKKLGISAFAAGFALGAGTLYSQSVSTSTEVIVKSGDPTPLEDSVFATDTFGFLRVFSTPDLSDRGEVAFRAIINTDPNGEFAVLEQGMYRGDVDEIVRIARQGLAPPDLVGVFNTSGDPFEDPVINETGVVAFQGNIEEPGKISSGLFLGTGQPELQQRARGTVSDDFIFLGVDADISIASEPTIIGFVGGGTFFQNGAMTGGVFRTQGIANGGLIDAIVVRSDPSPDANGVFQNFFEPSINNRGFVAFMSELSLTQDRFTDAWGIFMGSERIGGELNVDIVVRSGQTTPSGQGTFLMNTSVLSPGLGIPEINGSEQVAFRADLTTSGAYEADHGIYIWDKDSGLSRVVRTGNSFGDQGMFGLLGQANFNDRGEVAFRADLNGMANPAVSSGIFRGDGVSPANRITIALANDAPPELNGAFQTFADPAINDQGQVAFYSILTKTSESENEGIYFWDENLGMFKVARKGDPLLGSFITELNFNNFAGGYDDNEHRPLNNSNQVAYGFRLDDGRNGIALWTLSPPVLPETLVNDINFNGGNFGLNWPNTTSVDIYRSQDLVTWVKIATADSSGAFTDENNLPPPLYYAVVEEGTPFP